MHILGGEKKGLTLKTRGGSGTRPLAARVKASLFDMLAPVIDDCCFFDMFAGNGAVGIEALSRGAGTAFFYEKNHACIQIIRDNLRRSGYEEKARVFRTDAIRASADLALPPDAPSLIFLGAPYDSGLAVRALSLLGENPLFKKDDLVIAETRKQEPMEETWGRLKLIREKIYGETRLSFFAVP
ncbi:MAG TPA: 16S rRNA (guanine(966)-N(2))-methyltransferase RsmD [Candidatus Sumerlaeota bacterium]|mgnify:CR=1 FL=1|nr:16S rRNA (guanine(966)-N(2))-methyltransferase RsmD [Candidatus Sumerlaeota bacterium]